MEEENNLQSSAEESPSFESSVDEQGNPDISTTILPTAKRHWYQTWWGIGGMVVGAILLVLAGLFLVNFIKFYQMIKQGKGAELEAKYNGAAYQVNPQLTALRLELESGDHPYLGNPQAPVTIVEFVDYKCPYCKDEASIIYRLGQTYGNKVKIIIRDFPSESLHPGATDIAKLANCAYKMGFYWPAYNWIFTNQDNLPSSTVSDEYASQFANEFGVDSSKFLTCFKSPEINSLINRNFADGYRFGVHGTPTFFVNGEKTQGVIDYGIWEGYVKQFK